MKKLIQLIIILFITSNLVYAQDAQNLYKQGMSYLLKAKNISKQEDLNKQEVKEAIKIFRQITTNYPGTKWAEISQNQIAWIYYKGKAYQKSQTEFSNLIVNYPASMQADDWQFMIAQIKYNLLKYSESKTECEKLINKYSSKQNTLLINRLPGSYFLIAQSKLKQKKYNDAKASFNEFLSKYPDHALASQAIVGIAESEYRQGYESYNSGNHSQALEFFNKAISIYNNKKTKYILSSDIFPDSYYMKAEINLKLGNKEEAKSLLEYIVSEFIPSPIAIKARQKLEELNK